MPSITSVKGRISVCTFTSARSRAFPTKSRANAWLPGTSVKGGHTSEASFRVVVWPDNAKALSSKINMSKLLPLLKVCLLPEGNGRHTLNMQFLFIFHKDTIPSHVLAFITGTLKSAF